MIALIIGGGVCLITQQGEKIATGLLSRGNLETLDRMAAALERMGRPEGHMMRARIHVYDGDLEGAAEQYRLVPETDPRKPILMRFVELFEGYDDDRQKVFDLINRQSPDRRGAIEILNRHDTVVLEGKPRCQSLFLRGFLLTREGDFGPALKDFEAIDGKYPALQPYIDFYIAKCQRHSGNPEEALDRFKTLSKGVSTLLVTSLAQLEAGELLLLSGDVKKGIEMLEEIRLDSPVSPAGPAGLYALIAYFEETDPDKVWEFTDTLLANHQSAPEALLVASDLYSRLTADCRVGGKDVSLETVLDAGYVHLASGQLGTARDIFNKLIEHLKDAEARKAYGEDNARLVEEEAEYGLGRVAYGLGKHSDCRSILEKLGRRSQRSSIKARCLFRSGLSCQKQRPLLDNRAINYFKQTIEIESEQKPYALWELGETYTRLRKYDSAKKYLEQLVMEYPEHEQAAYAIRELIAFASRDKDDQRVIELADLMKKHHIHSQWLAMAGYFKGQSLLRLNLSNQALDTFRETASAFRSSYYGYRSRPHVIDFTTAGHGEGLATFKFVDGVYDRSIPSGEKGFYLGAELLDCLVYPLAQAEFEHQLARPLTLRRNQDSRDFHYSAPLAGSALYMLMEIQHDFDNTQEVIRLSKEIIRNNLEQELTLYQQEKMREMAWPLMFFKEVTEVDEKYRQEPALALAVIRRESAFDPGAVSTSNARGLMQVLPRTGQTIARRLKIRPWNTDRLHEPAINVLFGSYVLYENELLFPDGVEYALGAYNGGVGRMRGYISDLPRDDLDLFIEMIYIRESREYIKWVLRNREVYREMLGELNK